MAHSATQMATDYDVVFSCLPLLSIPVRISVRILQQARQRLLARNGTLVLFQYSHLSEKLLSRYFHWKRLRVVRNFRRRWCMSVRHVNYSVFTITTTSSSYCRRRSRLPTPAGVQRFRFVGDEMQNRMMALPRRFDDRHLRAVGNALAAVIGMHEDAGQPRGEIPR